MPVAIFKLKWEAWALQTNFWNQDGHPHHSCCLLREPREAASHSGQLEGDSRWGCNPLDLACLSGMAHVSLRLTRSVAQALGFLQGACKTKSSHTRVPAGRVDMQGVPCAEGFFSVDFPSSEGAALALCKVRESFDPWAQNLETTETHKNFHPKQSPIHSLSKDHLCVLLTPITKFMTVKPKFYLYRSSTHLSKGQFYSLYHCWWAEKCKIITY